MVAGRYIGNDPEAFFPKAGEKGAVGGLHILLIAPRKNLFCLPDKRGFFHVFRGKAGNNTPLRTGRLETSHAEGVSCHAV